jgi:NTE family protein/lysophospholipid hydrolase
MGADHFVRSLMNARQHFGITSARSMATIQPPADPVLPPGRPRVPEDLGPTSLAAIAATGQPLTLAPGQALFSERHGVEALYFLHAGRLHATEPDAPREPRVVRIIGAGEAVDRFQEMSGARHPVSVHAVEASTLTVVPASEVDRLVESHGDIRELRNRLHRRQLLTRLHRLFGALNDRLLDDLELESEWLHVHRGGVIMEPGDPSDGLWFVISGRIGTFRVTAAGQEVAESERTRGDTLGESGFLTGRSRSYRARALRDSVLVGYRNDAFERLIVRHPHVVRHITAGVALRVATAAAARAQRAANTNSTLTIALVAAGERSPIGRFAQELIEPLGRFGGVLHLDSARVDALLSEPGISQSPEGSDDENRLLAWLDACEARHRFLICETDPEPSAWSRRCIRRADRILLVAAAKELHEPSPQELELTREWAATTDQRTSLILTHPDGSHPPSGTRYWLDARPNVAAHYHVRWTEKGDFGRVARVLAGRSIGLVLGGGGARGFAHIGVLRALHEAGIPVDMIGGTSMGASVAGQYAMARTADEIATMSRKVFIDMKPHRGFTLPVLSLVNSHRMVLAGKACYGETEIEDLWLPFFCVSSNLTTAEVMIHRRGVLWKAALASTSLPGIGTPVLHGNHLLVDGAVLNNLPTDVMRRMGAGVVMASAVSVEDTETFTCQRVPSVWEVLSASFVRRPRATRFPTIFEVVMRASLLHSRYRERLSVQEADVALRPSLEGFGLLEFERIDDIVAEGYAHAGKTIAAWREAGRPLFG